MLFVAAAIAGLGSGLQFPAIMMLMGRIAPPAVIGGAVGLAMAAMKLASFLSPYYMMALAGISGNNAVQFPILVASICFAVLAMFFIVANWKPKAVPAAQQG
jgi:MFS family permease